MMIHTWVSGEGTRHQQIDWEFASDLGRYRSPAYVMNVAHSGPGVSQGVREVLRTAVDFRRLLLGDCREGGER